MKLKAQKLHLKRRSTLKRVKLQAANGTGIIPDQSSRRRLDKLEAKAQSQADKLKKAEKRRRRLKRKRRKSEEEAKEES